MHEGLKQLARELEGELYTDDGMRILYATDASSYREWPLAIAIPKSDADLRTLIAFSLKNNSSLIPRTAGTSLAGQVVGAGIVVDLSKHFTRILELNPAQRWVRVQPGVIRDDLNLFLRPHGLFFGPETSTANRAMIGGMVGNNSCGSNSIRYGSTREHLLEVRALLGDGSNAVFHALSLEEFHAKCEGASLEADIYRKLRSLLGNYENQEEIRREFPKKSVRRRNTGYAVDSLLDTAPFTAGGPAFNFCRLLAGSEGTLALSTEIKLNLEPIPSGVAGLLCVHFHTVDEALRANLIALSLEPSASELIDHYILECTKDNIDQRRNRFFVQGDPGAILVIEYRGADQIEVRRKAGQAESEMRVAGLGFHFPLLFGADCQKIWSLRKAGLGLLGNMPGDNKAVAVIEDTAVDVLDLPDYIHEFNELLSRHGLYSVHYAHAGSGELHLRPIINLKKEEGHHLYRTVAEEIASLVKKYQGSLSGEHGDGRLRGEFIRRMVGEKNYDLLRSVKKAWDPKGIFNPGKIVDAPPMDRMLRYSPGQQTPAFFTHFRFYQQDILQHAEQCNGSGDCRKTHLSGGTMCPSFMATRNEKDTTRARANILREFLTRSTQTNRFDHQEIYDVMDLCLSCKGCKSECPSNVDVAKLKAEFLQHYYDAHGVPMRAALIARFSLLARMGSWFPPAYNFFMTAPGLSRLVKAFSGFASRRSLPTLPGITLNAWYRRWRRQGNFDGMRRVYLFCDEFTNYPDSAIGIQAVRLLHVLGYDVVIPKHVESGRAALSKGLLRRSRRLARENLRRLAPLITPETPMVGIEPSAILCFRDEYVDLVPEEELAEARRLATCSLLIDEFLAREIDRGFIRREQFTREPKKIKLHGHCQQKALCGLTDTVKILSFPENFEVETLPTGCCGMAGSFGYEREHFDLSMQIGGLVLFPALRGLSPDVEIAASGTSCRHQIHDGLGIRAKHPVEILFEALDPGLLAATFHPS